MLLAVACADENYMPSAKFQMETAKKIGKVDRTIIYNINNDIDKEFREKNKSIFESGNGRRKGCYLWKPYFIKKALNSIEYGDYLVYMDAAGFYYRSKVSEAIKYMEKEHITMIGSCNGLYLNKDWTKRDAFVFMGCDTEEYTLKYQCLGGYMLLKKTAETENIIHEWLIYAQNYNIITEAPNVCGKDNYEGFIEHRHDQSIFSLLMIKYKIPIIENLPIPNFGFYHHTMGCSVKEIKRIKGKERQKQIYDMIKKKDLKAIWYVERERVLNWVMVQRIYKKMKLG